ncbi:putative oxidoreductase YjmC-like protein, partial [Leptotrombidium deliense]
SHGLNRLPLYIDDIKTGHCITEGSPQIINETPATAYVDGQNLLGFVVAQFCMKTAIKKAKEVGVGWVVTKGSNHFGTADTFTVMAAQEGLIGFCCTNTSPLVCTMGGKKPFFGTNPLSVAAFGHEK